MDALAIARKAALVAFLGEGTDPADVQASDYDPNTFLVDERREYLVLTDEEANDAVRNRIMDSLWAFEPNFVVENSRLKAEPQSVRVKLAAALGDVMGRMCEDANPLVAALIDNMDDFIARAIEADGRGHFLNSYDGSEEEQEQDGTTFYIIRQN